MEIFAAKVLALLSQTAMQYALMVGAAMFTSVVATAFVTKGLFSSMGKARHGENNAAPGSIQDKINTLKNDNLSLKEQLQQTLFKLDQIKVQAENLSNKIQLDDIVIDDLQKENLQLIESLKQIEADRNKLEALIQKNDQSLQSLEMGVGNVDSMSEENGKLKSKIMELEYMLENQSGDVVSEITEGLSDELQSQVAALLEENEKLKDKLEETADNLDDVKEKANSLYAKLQDDDVSKDELLDENEQLVESVAKLQENNDDIGDMLDGEADNLEGIKEVSQTVDALEAENKALKQRIAALEANLASLAGTGDQNSDLPNPATDMEERLTKLQDENDLLKDTLSENNSHLTELEDESKDNKDQFSKGEIERDHLIEYQHKLEDQLGKLKNSNGAIVDKLTEANKDLNILKIDAQQLEDLKLANQALTAKMSKFGEMAKLPVDEENGGNDITSEQSLSDLEARFQKLIEENKALKKRIKVIDTKLGKLQNKASKLIDQLKSKNIDSEQLAEINKELLQELGELKSENEALLAKLDENDKEMKDISGGIGEYKNLQTERDKLLARLAQLEGKQPTAIENNAEAADLLFQINQLKKENEELKFNQAGNETDIAVRKQEQEELLRLKAENEKLRLSSQNESDQIEKQQLQDQVQRLETESNSIKKEASDAVDDLRRVKEERNNALSGYADTASLANENNELLVQLKTFEEERYAPTAPAATQTIGGDTTKLKDANTRLQVRVNELYNELEGLKGEAFASLSDDDKFKKIIEENNDLNIKIQNLTLELNEEKQANALNGISGSQKLPDEIEDELKRLRYDNGFLKGDLERIRAERNDSLSGDDKLAQVVDENNSLSVRLKTLESEAEELRRVASFAQGGDTSGTKLKVEVERLTRENQNLEGEVGSLSADVEQMRSQRNKELSKDEQVAKIVDENTALGVKVKALNEQLKHQAINAAYAGGNESGTSQDINIYPDQGGDQSQLIKTKAEAEDLKRQNQNLEAELGVTKADVEQLRKQRNDDLGTDERAQQIVDENNKLHGEMEELNKQIKNYQLEGAVNATDVEVMKNNANKYKEAQLENDNLKDRVRGLSMDNERLQHSKDKQFEGNEDVTPYIQDNSRLRRELDIVRKQLDDLKLSGAIKESDLAAMQNDLNKLESERNDIDFDFEAAAPAPAQTQEASENVTGESSTAANLQSKVAILQATIQGLESENEVLKEHSSGDNPAGLNDADFMAMEVDNKNLKKQISDLEEVNNDLQHEIKMLEKERNKLYENHSDGQSNEVEFQVLEGQKHKVENDLKIKAREVKALQDETGKLKEKLKEVNTLRERLTASKTQVDGLKRELKNSNLKFGAESRQMKSEISKKQKDITTLTMEFNKFKAAMKGQGGAAPQASASSIDQKTLAALKTMKMDITRKTSTITSLQSQNKTLKQQIEKYKQIVLKLKKQAAA